MSDAVTVDHKGRVVPVCGITRSTGRFEWQCVAPVHDDGKHSHRRSAYGYVAKSERHLMVRRYPHSNH